MRIDRYAALHTWEHGRAIARGTSWILSLIQ